MTSRLSAWLLLGWLAASAHHGAPGADGAASPAGSAAAGSTPLVLISIDGFRWDYLDRHPAPNLRRLAREGVAARGLVPVFPSKTFPNHYTIVTGLHPDRHGVVANTMADAVLGRFSLADRAAVEDGRWWGGEPIWVTAERQGLRAATCFWPGSEAEIGGVRPTYWLPYDGQLAGEERVRIVLGWLDLPADRRPSFLTLYWSDVDGAGHDTGTRSPETAAAIARVDRWIGLLLEGLEERGLFGRVNLLVVSDHGMADTPGEQTLVLEDFVDLAGVEVTGETPAIFLRPPPERVEPIRRALAAAHPVLTVWRRESTPRSWRYRDHPRIPPLIVAVEEGWNLREARGATGRPPPLGMHGYDPRLRSMHGILIGHGPGLAVNARVGRIENLHLYELMCHLLGIEPAENEGRLRAVRGLLAKGH
ncbi:MAG TPA: ectonucleotide pyrophosphatase/phosphodiesterase [Thermoanaerobaculia bacterium]|nr:ectonucleotide pyrophosphatase/phosphodiesterase [Thermoanaerobaculia bacterium]